MDKNEFTRKVLEAEPTLYRVSKSILKNDFDCADAVQEAILKAFQNLNKLKEERYFKTWLCRILIRECYRLLSSRKNTIPFEDYAKTAPAFEQEMHRNIGIYSAIMRLKDKHRLVITLHYIEGFKTSEISKMLKIPEGTVKSRISRAKSELRLLLELDESGESEAKHNKEGGNVDEKFKRVGKFVPEST